MQVPALTAAERLSVEEWLEWLEAVLVPAVLRASLDRDDAELVARVEELDAKLASGCTVRAAALTAADVALWACLHPLMSLDLLSEQRTPAPALRRWFAALGAQHGFADVASSERCASGLDMFAALPRPAAAASSKTFGPPADPTGESFCITTAINYANGLPHMGHAYEAISADVIARYHRAYGRKVNCAATCRVLCGVQAQPCMPTHNVPTQVLFMTGADEHGQKIAETAAGKGCRPIDLCNTYVSAFQA